jgi:protein-tyrosine phosphatase
VDAAILHPARLLRWDGCFNARDLGGYPTDDGETRWRAVVRADSLTRLTSAGRQALLDYGVHTIVDLRTPGEWGFEPRPFAGESNGLRYVNVPLLDAEGHAAAADMASPALMYGFFLERARTGFGTALRAIADAPEGGVLVHCAIGRDRTGLVSALLLSLAGVAPETVAADYALSHQTLQPLFDEWVSAAPDDHVRERIERYRACDASNMLATLETLEREHGGAAGYLRDAGLDDDRLERLRVRLVDRSR